VKKHSAGKKGSQKTEASQKTEWKTKPCISGIGFDGFLIIGAVDGA
jgi:hypothetical protein